MRKFIVGGVVGFALSLGLLASNPAGAMGLDPAFKTRLLGSEQAKGVVVWSHGRSINSEDSRSPTPPYLRVLRDGGWDVMRFDRLRENDTLEASSARLARIADKLKREGYRRVVLAGQSFGAFLSLMAADRSGAVDAVVATAPAAYGDFQDFYSSWRLNATRLYPLLAGLRKARVMLFYFHDDDFDPGGRAAPSQEILEQKGLGYAVIDQPPYLTTHWASSTGLFLRRYGPCIREFIEDDGLAGPFFCHPQWGRAPSAELRLPPELTHPDTAAPARLVATGASRPDAAATPAVAVAPQAWYGFYPNGREVLVAIERVSGRKVSAVYAIGPGLGKNEPSEWTRRDGRIVGDEFVFKGKGKSTLRFHRRDNGGIDLTWTARNGKATMEAGLRPIDLAAHFARQTASR